MPSNTARADRPDQSLSPRLARHFRTARVVLVAQSLLLFVAAALQPWIVHSMLAHPHPDMASIQSAFGPRSTSRYLYAAAVVIAAVYVGLAVASIVPVMAMHKRTAWTWLTAVLASVAAFALACMPFGIYVVWVLLQPGVRSAMEPIRT